MWPLAKDFKQPLEGRAEKKKGTDSPWKLPEGAQLNQHHDLFIFLAEFKLFLILTYGKWNDQMNCEALISYSRPRKPMHKYR